MSDIIVLNEIIESNIIDTRWFLPFVIHRLQPLAHNRVVVLDVVLQTILDEPLVLHPLQLTWNVRSEQISVPPIQEHVITELAACGLACVFVPLYTNWQVLQVTQVGDSFDYWVGDEHFEFGLEISGTMSDKLEQRHHLKVRQLLQNRHHVAGYVSVTSFGSGRAIFFVSPMEKGR